jgi:hypothetical protein
MNVVGSCNSNKPTLAVEDLKTFVFLNPFFILSDDDVANSP